MLYCFFIDLPQRSNHVMEPKCPKLCDCKDDVQVVNCTKRGLNEVPIDIPLTAYIIDLSHNQLQEIYPENFSNRSKLTELYLNDNQLTNVKKQVKEQSNDNLRY